MFKILILAVLLALGMGAANAAGVYVHIPVPEVRIVTPPVVYVVPEIEYAPAVHYDYDNDNRRYDYKHGYRDDDRNHYDSHCASNWGRGRHDHERWCDNWERNDRWSHGRHH